MYLMPVGLGGTVTRLNRRQRAIEGMRSHGGLLSSISDPNRQRRDTADAPGTSTDISALDESKQLALNGIWRTQPIYTLQGPPETGKTKLLETMTTRLLEMDVSTQVLITPHSHEAVRHVHRNLSARIASLPATTRPIVVRLDDNDDNDHVRRTAGRLAHVIAKSALAESAPSHTRARALSPRTSRKEAHLRVIYAVRSPWCDRLQMQSSRRVTRANWPRCWKTTDGLTGRLSRKLGRRTGSTSRLLCRQATES